MKNLRLVFTGIITLTFWSTTGCNKEDDPTPNPPTPSPMGTMTDNRDGNQYATVKIGNQTWMAENLRYLPAVFGPENGSYDQARYYVYGYTGTNVNEAKSHPNYAKYGVLYNWVAVMDGGVSSTSNPSGVKGVCPNGWHLPSDEEWTQLENYLIENGYNHDGTTTGSKFAKSLASKTDWSSSDIAGSPGNGIQSNNSTGFNALPSAGRSLNGTFSHYPLGDYAIWWSSTYFASNQSYSRWLYHNQAHMARIASRTDNGRSCRCVKD